jgi:hypothetical protein
VTEKRNTFLSHLSRDDSSPWSLRRKLGACNFIPVEPRRKPPIMKRDLWGALLRIREFFIFLALDGIQRTLNGRWFDSTYE